MRMLWVFCVVWMVASASAQDGQIGQGHDKWHGNFYNHLTRPGSNQSCCSLSDCRPTQVRVAGDHWEIMKDGRWVSVPLDKVIHKPAPDGGAHICAPDSESTNFDRDFIFCIIMPPEI